MMPYKEKHSSPYPGSLLPYPAKCTRSVLQIHTVHIMGTFALHLLLFFIVCIATGESRSFNSNAVSVFSSSYPEEEVDDISEQSNLQLNKDIEILYLTVDLPSLLSFSSVGRLLRRWRRGERGTFEGELEVLKDIYRRGEEDAADFFIRLIKSDSLQRYLSPESLARTPLVLYVESAVNKGANEAFRNALASKRILRLLSDRVMTFAFYS